MSLPFKITNMLVAEYIVEGKDNKHTIINTYSGDVLVSDFPASIPVAFYMEAKPLKDYSGMLSIKLMLGRDVAMEGGAHVDLRTGSPAVIAIPTGLIKLKSATTMKLYVGIDGEAPIKAVAKKFSLSPALASPTA